jgi:hypothetical protein
MSLLWITAMPWHQMPGDSPRTPVSVRHAGFASYVGAGDNADLHEMTAPSMTPEQMQYTEEHNDYTPSYKQEHRERYEKAKANLTDEDMPDHEDPRLYHFMRGGYKVPWKVGLVDTTEVPIHATQSHVASEHVQRYTEHPDDRDHWGTESLPVLVKHQDRWHAMDGHHRIAAGIARHEKDLPVQYFDLDDHYLMDYDSKGRR